ncbi:hypothetical protein MRB53_012972 [Persea americana]|uniref:Uncharacterized protein n=1 Tax=Persea americana TaxID=3435 RepID=A0ACC2LZ60_PERAE|nr:hypothetical protein MRB53_012972 [Persea americana]
MLLQLLHRVLPSGAKLAESYYQARKLTENLGFTYETLDACPNNCMLFRNENAHLDTCIVCQTSRWKENEVGYNRQNSSTSVVNRGKRVAAKQIGNCSTVWWALDEDLGGAWEIGAIVWFLDLFDYYVNNDDQEVFSKELQLDAKVFYFDIGENKRGRFLKGCGDYLAALLVGVSKVELKKTSIQGR